VQVGDFLAFVDNQDRVADANETHLDNFDRMERPATELEVKTQESRSSLKMPTEKTEKAIFDSVGFMLVNETLKLEET